MRTEFSFSMTQMNRFSDFRNLYMIPEVRKLGKKILSDNEHRDFEKNRCLTTQSREKTTRWTSSELRQYYLKPAVNCQPSYRGRALSPGRYHLSLNINKILKIRIFIKFWTSNIDFGPSFYQSWLIYLNPETLQKSKSI